MLHIIRILNELGILVELNMTLGVENSGNINISNNRSIVGSSRHIDARLYFLRDLKEEGNINTVWKPDKNNSSDSFTNNLLCTYLNRHMNIYCVDNSYYNPTKGE